VVHGYNSSEIATTIGSMSNCYYLENKKEGNVEAGSAEMVTDKSRFVTILNNYVTENNKTEGKEKLKEWNIANNELYFKD